MKPIPRFARLWSVFFQSLPFSRLRRDVFAGLETALEHLLVSLCPNVWFGNKFPTCFCWLNCSLLVLLSELTKYTHTLRFYIECGKRVGVVDVSIRDLSFCPCSHLSYYYSRLVTWCAYLDPNGALGVVQDCSKMEAKIYQRASMFVSYYHKGWSLSSLGS